ncbi:MAG: hypothetical protein JRE63_00885 [Deltaproteobacteria bacterium]|jgi:hypothetical protein|nr:hypothetical protein [Deltaproteobacteria bacterium]
MKNALRKISVLGCLTFVMMTGLATQGHTAGVTVYKDGDKYVKVGGRIQLQYHYEDPDEGDSTDEVFFRRLRPYLEGSIHKDWKGKFQFDYGKAEDDNEVSIKDAYMQYKGIDNVKITLGNANFPFSRELLTSSKKQQLVERTFVGDHNYGTPDRNAGLHITGGLMDNQITFGVSAAASDIDPDAKKLDFDTPVNRNDDFNQGWMFGGRVDWHPMGYLKMEQGDFKRDEIKATLGVAAFAWDNDDDNNTNPSKDGNAIDDSGDFILDDDGDFIRVKKPDVDSVTGFEVSGAFRGYGVSVDAEYNLFDAETIDSTYNGGLYEDGETELENFAIEGGYMVIPSKLEIVAGYQVQDADNYDEEWERTSFGLNYFFKKHDIKLQATYRMGENKDGVKDNDLDELFVQAQYVF